MTRPARLGTDLDAVPVANATERTAPTWEARALAAEARLVAVAEEVRIAERTRVWRILRDLRVIEVYGDTLASYEERVAHNRALTAAAERIAEAQP